MDFHDNIVKEATFLLKVGQPLEWKWTYKETILVPLVSKPMKKRLAHYGFHKSSPT